MEALKKIRVKHIEGFNIVERGWGISDRFPNNEIRINKHLHEYPELLEGILNHEVKHTRHQGFTKKDLVHDLATKNQYSQWQLMKFCLRHPLALLQAVPIYYTRKDGIVFDINAMITMAIVLGFVGIAIWIGLSL